MNETTSTTATTILRNRQVQQRTGLSRSSLYLKISEGTFPKPLSLGSRAVGWRSDAVQSWIERRPVSSQQPPQALTTKPGAHERSKSTRVSRPWKKPRRSVNNFAHKPFQEARESPGPQSQQLRLHTSPN